MLLLFAIRVADWPGKSCSFLLFMNVYHSFPFDLEGGMQDFIVFTPGHCLSYNLQVNCCSSFFKYSIYANLDK